VLGLTGSSPAPSPCSPSWW